MSGFPLFFFFFFLRKGGWKEGLSDKEAPAELHGDLGKPEGPPRGSPSPAWPSSPISVNPCARSWPHALGPGGVAVTWPGFGRSPVLYRALM